jgi:single-stranded-DNA-specific exonuclease
MRWQIHHDCTNSSPQDILQSILNHRGLNTTTAIQEFLTPTSPLDYQPSDVDIDNIQLQTTVQILKSSISNHQPIIIYGDYDADGITATAILWEALHSLKANAIPFIPSREQHGYGLSINGIHDALSLTSDQHPLIITVDNGIVAHEAATWLHQRNIPLIITDHHTKTDQLPQAQTIVHSTQISGAGVAWFLAKELASNMADPTLDLVTIGTIADMMPLFGVNRSLVKHGLNALRHSHRPGIKALFKQAAIPSDQPLSTYHVNYIIAPRLNAMGRLEHALDSLRLICTKNQSRAAQLASKLGNTNQTRQDLTIELLNFAASQVDSSSLQPVIISEDEQYHEGIIGLIAGKLVETFYRPSIVISKKKDVSKASARSIKGVNITELIRTQQHLLLNFGGHPMAAGFSIKTDKIDIFKHDLLDYAQKNIDTKLFEPVLDIDCSVNVSDITQDLYHQLQLLEPFGIGNKEPVFSLHQAQVISAQPVGKTGNHLKLRIKQGNTLPLDAIWFNLPHSVVPPRPGETVSLAGTISMNTWRNKSFLQIILKDVQV